MPGAIDLQLTGADRLASTARSTVDQIEELNATEGDRAGTLVLDVVRPPILTGALAATVHVVSTPDGFGVAAGGEGAPYAAIVHARQPFITAAFLAREDSIVNTYADALDAALDTLGGA